MGELSDFLNSYSDFSQEAFQEILKILKEKYCWKCPMRSTSEQSNCREVDAWLRLTSALEEGICQYIDSQRNLHFSAIFLKYLTRINKQHSLTYDKRVLIKINQDLSPFASKGSILIIDENVQKIRANDLVLIPEVCPIYAYNFSRLMNVGTMPFKIFQVTNKFSKFNVKHLKTDSGLQIPCEYVLGRITKILSSDRDAELFK